MRVTNEIIIPISDRPIIDIEFQPDDNPLVAVLSEDNKISIVNYLTSTFLCSLKLPNIPVKKPYHFSEIKFISYHELIAILLTNNIQDQECYILKWELELEENFVGISSMYCRKSPIGPIISCIANPELYYFGITSKTQTAVLSRNLILNKIENYDKIQKSGVIYPPSDKLSDKSTIITFSDKIINISQIIEKNDLCYFYTILITVLLILLILIGLIFYITTKN